MSLNIVFWVFSLEKAENFRETLLWGCWRCKSIVITYFLFIFGFNSF